MISFGRAGYAAGAAIATCVGSLFALLLAACTPATDASRTRDSTEQPAASVRVDLTGAGATFPYPLYARWFNEYAQRADTRINYRSIGSSAGILQLLAGEVDFGASDVPLTDAEMAQAKFPIMHVPMIVGAVAITYNLPQVSGPLKLSGDVIADIFLGRVTDWSDERIAALNRHTALPATPIHVVHRDDGSGTSYILSDYLSAVNTRWAAGPGRGRAVRWPTGRSVSGNESVAAEVKSVVGAVGYLEVVYARQNRLPVAQIRNRAGKFVWPTAFEVASAAATARTFSSAMDSLSSTPGDATDLRASIVNAPGDHSYPISSFTWMLVSAAALDGTKLRQIRNFLRWALTDGTDIASQLGYVPLPTDVANRVLDRLDSEAGEGGTGRARVP